MIVGELVLPSDHMDVLTELSMPAQRTLAEVERSPEDTY